MRIAAVRAAAIALTIVIELFYVDHLVSLALCSPLVNSPTRKPRRMNLLELHDRPAATLRALAQMLLTIAEMKDQNLLDVPAGTPAAPSAPLAPPAPPAPLAASNVLPFAAPAGGPFSVPATPIAPAAAAGEYDSAGVPWDARIHQKKKTVKADGSWKLQKGIADSIVEFVMKDLAPRIRSSSAAAPPAPPAGSLPPAHLAPPPIPPVNSSAQAPLAPAAPPAPASPGAVDTDEAYRALVNRIVEARTAKGLSPEDLSAHVYAPCGVPSLQALRAMPGKIPEVATMLDALIASR